MSLNESEVTADAPAGPADDDTTSRPTVAKQREPMYNGRANLAAFRWLLMRHGSSARVGTERCIPRALLFLSPLMVLLALFMGLIALLLSPRVFHLYTLAHEGLASAWVPAACPKPTHTYTPLSESEVVSIVSAAVKRCPKGGLSIRASRQGWHSNAFFPCADENASCESIQLDMTKLNKVLAVDESNRLVRVQPGALLNEVMDVISKHNELNFRPEFMTIYTGLTVGGMVLAAAHGSSIEKPSAFGNLLQALSFVDGKGRLHQVTGPEARGFIGSTGMFGIVTELTFAVDPPIKHFMSVMKRSDAHFEEELPHLLNPENMTAVFQRSLWFPHAGDMITKRHIDMHPDVPGEAQHTFFRSKPLFAEFAAVGMKLDQLNFLQGLLPTDKLICATMRRVPGVWYSEHMSYVPWNQSMVGWAHDLTGSSCVGNDYGCYWHTMSQVLIELDMPWENLLPWMADVRKIVGFASGCLPSLLGFTLRFGTASEHPLDMAYGRNTVYVDILVSKGFASLPAVHQDLFDEIEQMSLLKYDARPHWGKNPVRAFLDTRSPVRHKYPLFQDMLDKAARLDPQGVFLSPMHKAMIAAEGPERFLKGVKNCAVNYLCYCSKDSDCGIGHVCAEGRVYTEFKVCRRKRFWFA